MMTNAERIIHEMAAHSAADMRLCGAAYRIISAEPTEKQNDLFVRTLLEYRFTPTSGDWELPEICSKREEIKSFVKMRSEYETLKEELKGEFTDPVQFNAEMWRRISDEGKYPNQIDRFTLMEHCATDEFMPRLATPAVPVSEEDFSRLKKEIAQITILKAKAVSCLCGRHSIETAAYMLNLIDSCENEAERVAMMSIVLNSTVASDLLSMLERDNTEEEPDSNDD